MPDAITFHFDPLCPWCFQTSRWVHQLARAGEVTVRWGVFSLEVQNFDKPVGEFDPVRGRGTAALRTCVAVRDDEGDDALGRFYEALGTRYHQGMEELTDPATTRAALTDVGLDPETYDRAVADPATWQVVIEEHRRLVDETRSFGVPTIRLDDGTGLAIFGPVVSNPPADDAEAVELWHHVSWLTRYGNFSELKRDRVTTPDLERSHQRRRAAEQAARAEAEQPPSAT